MKDTERKNFMVVLLLAVIGIAAFVIITGYPSGEEQTALSLTVEYADGTTRTFGLGEGQIPPLTIYDDTGKEVVSIGSAVTTTIEHTMTTHVKYEYNVYDFDVQNEYMTDMGWTSSGWLVKDKTFLSGIINDYWISGSGKVKTLDNWDASDIESMCSYGSGTYRLTFRVSVRVILYSDTDSTQKEGYGSLTWQYTYDEGTITSMSVKVTVA